LVDSSDLSKLLKYRNFPLNIFVSKVRKAIITVSYASSINILSGGRGVKSSGSHRAARIGSAVVWAMDISYLKSKKVVQIALRSLTYFDV